MKIEINKIQGLVSKVLEGLEFRLVRLKVYEEKKSSFIQVMIEYKEAYEMQVVGDGGITPNDCAKISRLLVSAMEEVGITSNSYFLEVSSPGIDRPLLLIEDFERFKGFKVSVKLHCSILEKKNFVGTIGDVFSKYFFLITEHEKIKVDIKKIHDTKLLLTDDLIEKSKVTKLESMSI